MPKVSDTLEVTIAFAILLFVSVQVNREKCTSMVRTFAHGVMVRRFDPSWLIHSYFSFQPVLHEWCIYKRLWHGLSCLWDGASKRILAANQK